MSLVLNSHRYGTVDFGPIFCAPFIRGFFGSMHWPMYILYLLGLTWKDTGFAAKTVTLTPHHGNVDLDKNGNCWWLWVKAVYFNFLKGCFVNAFGLSNPGLIKCLELGHWQKMKEPIIISLTSIAKNQEDRLNEAHGIAEILGGTLDSFQAPVALQWNTGCPNESVYKDMTEAELAREIIQIFDIFRPLGIPLILSCNALMPISVIKAVEPYVNAFWIGNTVPVGHPAIDWKKIFKNGISPLIRRGMKLAGGYSGPEALELTRTKVIEIHSKSWKPIIAGGGIRRNRDVEDLRDAGADAVFIGSIVLRPWRMRSVIDEAHM